ncbi:Na+/H+ antiporter [Arachidicoccus ginsenosidimutans]|uniref:Na+/H+ antiporter n=1 Tax=Arachidicoccus sp. BS20 TaxID=1850526 RepID=UPI0007F16D40|nr:Na+/H+ antiporter [Arachidicoccus sp. BS20]ANI88244.1 Na+/H+ antiporter [Arachidicoccus sp. BS20]
MIQERLLLILTLFFAMAVLYIISQRLKISYPIFLVIGGLGISFIPAVPNISITPDLVFLIFLPPLLFEAAWYTSWNEFWKWKQPISLLGFGLVLITSWAIASFALLIPGFTLALGFLLGGIISPPDAIAATSVLKGLRIPRRGIVILEGESLINDAASLTVFRFAITAVITGQFVIQKAAINFLVLAIMGIFIGVMIGYLLYLILKYWARSSSITTPITLIAPYVMYIVAESFHWSGVLAVVSGGLFLSSRSSDFLNYHTRMQTREVWATAGFLLNGFVFILIGLELPNILSGLEGYSMKQAISYALAISFIVIIVRIVLVYVALFLPRMVSRRRIWQKGVSPGKKLPFLIGWAGMRGVVSLASALAIPITMTNGEAFPHRNLILFITFMVILITLIFQGLTLPLFVRWFNLDDIDSSRSRSEQLEEMKLHLTRLCIEYLQKQYHQELDKYENIQKIKEQLELNIIILENALNKEPEQKKMQSEKRLNKKIWRELVVLQRNEINRLRQERKYDDNTIKEMEYTLDLEEARLVGKF